MPPDFLALPENFGHLYYMENGSYLVHKFFFESLPRQPQNILEVGVTLKLLVYGHRICQALLWFFFLADAVRDVYPFISLQFVLANYNGGAIRGAASDQTRIWHTVLTEYVFMEGAIFIVNAEN